MAVALAPFLANIARHSQPERLAQLPRHSLTASMECRRRLSSGITALDAIIGGGIARGRVSEIVGRYGTGRTSLAAAFVAAATCGGEATAWIDSANAFAPHNLTAAGADLSRILWVGAEGVSSSRDHRSAVNAFKAAEMVLSAGGFGLVVLDLPPETVGLECRVLRLARAAERSGAAVLVTATRRTCGTFAALSLVLGHAQPTFSRTAPGAPMLFDGIRVEAYVARNKLGGSGHRAAWLIPVDPMCAAAPVPAAQKTRRARSTGRKGLAVNAA
ncbi:MAG TPA: ATPase domain-containing protein [Candidatus Binataceae bacterium]|nr:ATPase domain-containing protein [Candidatus Binataceae bacterium]